MNCSISEKAYVFTENKYFESCHASTVCRADDGGYLCACFGGTHEGAGDVSIWISRSDSSGRFGEPVKMRACEEPHWNPVLDRTEKGYALYFKVGASPREWRTMVSYSDDGVNWARPKELVPGDFSGGRGPVKNPVLRYKDMLIAPRSLESETE